MIVLYGIRDWQRKIVAYRNDFCLSCEEPRRAVQVRSIRGLHLFFIPVLPLYPRWRWECSACGRPPHSDPSPRTRKGFKRLIAMFSGMFALVAWVAPSSETGNSIAVTWVLRIVLSGIFLGSLWFMVKPAVSLHLSDKLKEIKPDQNDMCPLCNAPLMPDNGWRCSGCGVLRTTVRA